MAEFRGAVAELDAVESSLAALPTQIEDRMGLMNQLAERMVALGVITAKFQKRTAETDPITGNPRYGPKMMEKVQAGIKRYELMSPLVEAAHAEVASIFGQAKEERKVVEQQIAVEEQKRVQLEIHRKLEVERLAEQAAAVKAKEEEAKRQEEEEVRQQLAEAAAQSRAHRGEQQREDQEAEAQASAEAEAAFQARLASVQPGMDGLQAALAMVRSGSGEQEYKQCVKALHVLIEHVCQKPEEPMFRQIKLLNPRFDTDIGRHGGGLECMVAMGFKVLVREEEKLLLMEEPNLAQDMDRWSNWFDTLKEYRDCLEGMRI
jgi:hypothetical protein